MTGLLIFLLLVAGIFNYLLFAPFYLEINSIDEVCGIRFHHLATAKLVVSGNSLQINLKIAWWQKQIDLLANLFRKEEKRIVKKTSRKRRVSLSAITAIIKTFKINRFHLDMDTGNVQLNGMLYPGFYYLKKYAHVNATINFLNRNEIVVEIENNLARILKAIIYTSLRMKNHGKFK